MYVDIAHSNDLDNRKLTQGWFIRLAGALIKWALKKQLMVVMSFIVVEYLAIKLAA